MPADVKSCPLVSTQGGTTRVYFTCNNTPGGMFAWVEGRDTAHTLFSPEPGSEQANWCMSNVVSGEDGSLYYVNDSGYLFKLVPDDAEKPAGPGKPPTTPGKPDNSTRPNGAAQATTTIKLHSGVSISLVSNVDDKDAKAAEKDSRTGDGTKTGADSTGSDRPVGEAVTAAAEKTLEKTGAKMPWWPFVGMGVGLVLLVLVLRRRRESGEE